MIRISNDSLQTLAISGKISDLNFYTTNEMVIKELATELFDARHPDEEIITPNNCCVRFDEAIKDGVVRVVYNKGYYISEPKDNSYWDTALWRIVHCPFCGHTLSVQKEVEGVSTGGV